MTDTSSAKIPLPAFLKIMTNGNIAPSKAMAVSGDNVAMWAQGTHEATVECSAQFGVKF